MPALRLLHPSAYPNAREPFLPPLSPNARGYAPGLKRLGDDGTEVLNKAYQPAFTMLAEKSGASAQGTGIGPIKQAPRMLEKCLNDYVDVWPPYAAVCDVVRGTMAFKDPGGILAALENLVKWDGVPISGATYRIAQVKELFSKNFQSRYGDVKLSLLFYADKVPDGHLCELQLNTVALVEAKGTPEGHASYEAERTLAVTWAKEHPTNPNPPDLVVIEEQWALYQENPSNPELLNFGGKSRGMKGATVEDYIDLYRPLIGIAVRAYGPARDTFDRHPDAPRLIDRVKKLQPKVASRWAARFENNEAWSALG